MLSIKNYLYCNLSNWKIYLFYQNNRHFSIRDHSVIYVLGPLKLQECDLKGKKYQADEIKKKKDKGIILIPQNMYNYNIYSK